MSATAPEPLLRLPLPLPPELIAEVARRRADGRSWAAVGGALRLDAGALQGACAADPRVAPALAEAEEAAVREAELRALKRLSRLTESENERVALRASEVLLRYARERRQEQAEAKAVEAPKAAEVKMPPRLLDPAPAPKPVGAFRAVPDLSAARLAELVKGQ